MAASNVSPANGSCSTTARTTGAAPFGRCAAITAEGSTATDHRRSTDSYEPVPAPTLTTVDAPPSARSNCGRAGRAAVTGVAHADLVVVRHGHPRTVARANDPLRVRNWLTSDLERRSRWGSARPSNYSRRDV